MNNGKSNFGFSYRYIKYGKFWSVSLGHFIKHKPLYFWSVQNEQDFNLTNAVDEVFSKKAKLGRPPKIHQCKMCHKIVKCRQQLIIHVQLVHCAKKDKRCHICDKGFKRKQDLEVHIKRVHDENKGTQSFTSLMAVFRQDINRVFSFSKYNIWIFPGRNCSVKTLVH